METKFYKTITVVILAVCLIIVFIPNIYLTSVQKNILFLVASCMPALLFTKELDVKFDLSLPAFSITATGTAGLILSVFLLLNHVTDRGPYVTIYDFKYQNGNPVHGLDRFSTLEIKSGTDGAAPAFCISDNKIFLVFNREADIARVDYKLMPFHDMKSMDLGYNPKINVTEILK